MAFRFIHTADIHLDSPLTSLAMRNENLAEIVAIATRQVFVRLVDLCIAEKVDALLIAGDLYDGKQTSMKTARFLSAQLRRLDDEKISVFIIRGNHDAESRITRELTLPECVHVFTGKAAAVVVNLQGAEKSALERSVVIHGASFAKPHAHESLLPLFKQPDPASINIGMMHTSLDGAPGHDPYAPCALADLQAHGFDYWALGHIHKRAVYSGQSCTVVMPGIPQGRHIGESGAKSVTLVSVADDRSIELDERHLAIVQFEQIVVSFDDIQEWSVGINQVISEIDRTYELCESEHVVFRITLTGSTPLAWRLKRDGDHFSQEIKGRLEDDKQKWLDKLVVQCEPPDTKNKKQKIDTSSFMELHDLMIEEIKHSEVFENNGRQVLDNIIGLLPAELRSTFGENEAALSEQLELLALQGSALVAAKLQPSNSDESSADATNTQAKT